MVMSSGHVVLVYGSHSLVSSIAFCSDEKASKFVLFQTEKHQPLPDGLAASYKLRVIIWPPAIKTLFQNVGAESPLWSLPGSAG